MAALTVATTGLGATIAGTGLITTQITRIGDFNVSVDSLNISHLGTAGFESERPGDLRKNPEIEVEFNWLGASVPISTSMIPTSEPYTGISVTLTFPGAGSVTGTAFVKQVKFPSCEKGSIMKGSYTLQFDGATDLVYTAA
jgi:hypothetical protein